MSIKFFLYFRKTRRRFGRGAFISSRPGLHQTSARPCSPGKKGQQCLNVHGCTISDVICNRKNRQLYLLSCLTSTINFGGPIWYLFACIISISSSSMHTNNLKNFDYED